MPLIGIYVIECTATSKFYVGASLNIDRRFTDHKRALRLNKHQNAHLQNAYNKHGKESFSFHILESCNAKELASREQYWIDKLKVAIRDYGYNIRADAVPITIHKGIKKGKRKDFCFSREAVNYRDSKTMLPKEVAISIFQHHYEGAKWESLIKFHGIPRTRLNGILRLDFRYIRDYLVEDGIEYLAILGSAKRAL